MARRQRWSNDPAAGELVAELVELGATVKQGKKGHSTIVLPTGEVIGLASTTGTPRWNTARLRTHVRRLRTLADGA